MSLPFMLLTSQMERRKLLHLSVVLFIASHVLSLSGMELYRAGGSPYWYRFRPRYFLVDNRLAGDPHGPAETRAGIRV